MASPGVAPHNTERPMEALLNVPAEELYIPQTDAVDYIAHVVRQHLEHRFVGRCKGGCLIVGIGEIHQRSMARMAQDQLDGSANINVRFTALGRIVSPGDILVGCVVDTVRGHRVVLQGGHVLFTVVGPNLPAKVTKGQSVPVVVSRSTYVESSRHVAVDAVPFRAPYEICLYQVQHPKIIPPDLLAALREELNALYAAQKAFEDAPAVRRRYFRQLFHLLAEPIPASALPKGVRVVRAQEMAETLVEGRELAYGLLLQHPLSEASEGELLLMPPDMLTVNPGQRPPLAGPAVLHLEDLTSQSIHTKSILEIVAMTLQRQTRYLRMLAEMSVYYASDATFHAHENIWNIYGGDRAKVHLPHREVKKKGQGEAE